MATQTDRKQSVAIRLDDLPDVLTVEEAGRVLRLGRNSAYAAAADGRIPTVRIGRRKLVPKLAVIRLLEAANG